MNDLIISVFYKIDNFCKEFTRPYVTIQPYGLIVT